MNKALLLIDLQNDFCPGGSLAVHEGDLTVAVANQAIGHFKSKNGKIIASKDWHPSNHKSFASQSNTQIGELGELNGLPQIWWPDHCIAQSHGSEFHAALDDDLIDTVIYKGQNPEIDSYSAFFDNGKRQETGLNRWLKENNISHLTVMGLATDYCVKFTVLDALELGYAVDVLIDGCRGVNLNVDDSKNALQYMAEKGAKLIGLNQLRQ